MVKIMPARVADAQLIRRLEAKVWGEEVVNKYDIPMLIRFGWAYVAKDGANIVGAIYAYATKDQEAFVSDWVVDKKYRGQDIGLKLYKKLISSLKGRQIISFINPKNKTSLEAHEKLGFKKAGLIANPYGLKSGIEGGDRILVRHA